MCRRTAVAYRQACKRRDASRLDSVDAKDYAKKRTAPRTRPAAVLSDAADTEGLSYRAAHPTPHILMMRRRHCQAPVASGGQTHRTDVANRDIKVADIARSHAAASGVEGLLERLPRPYATTVVRRTSPLQPRAPYARLPCDTPVPHGPRRGSAGPRSRRVSAAGGC